MVRIPRHLSTSGGPHASNSDDARATNCGTYNLRTLEVDDRSCRGPIIALVSFPNDGFHGSVHDGPLAGQEVPHVHVHVLPRTPKDGGSTIAAMWPRSSVAEPDHDALGALASSITKEA